MKNAGQNIRLTVLIFAVVSYINVVFVNHLKHGYPTRGPAGFIMRPEVLYTGVTFYTSVTYMY